MTTPRIRRLISGGVITNYSCTSACRHCLYRCGSHRDKAYLEPGPAGEIFRTIRGLGCRAVHIGGGEPFLRPEGLGNVLDAARKAGVTVEYVETNASWFTEPDRAAAILEDLSGRGLSTLLVSISPFHNEFIPLARVRGVIDACRSAGIRVLPWISDFLDDLSRLDPGRPHDLTEYEEIFGKAYLLQVLRRYWIHMGGRAPDTFRPHVPVRPPAEILKGKPATCARGLSDTSHFHIDLHGNYIPGLCAGLAVDAEDLGKPLDPRKYPLITMLYGSGIKGLHGFAEGEFGFKPEKPAYINACDLCIEIRGYLVEEGYDGSEELRPLGFYG